MNQLLKCLLRICRPQQAFLHGDESQGFRDVRRRKVTCSIPIYINRTTNHNHFRVCMDKSCLILGIMFPILFCLMVLVSADVCRDLCINQLGRRACEFGSYCKNRDVCHGIHWTGKHKTAITVDVGADRYGLVVKCSDAQTFLRRSIFATRTTTARPELFVAVQTSTTPAPARAATATREDYDWFSEWSGPWGYNPLND